MIDQNAIDKLKQFFGYIVAGAFFAITSLVNKELWKKFFSK